ncbi:hypothetical protein GYMLUDRAFT_338442 [Collybiopsis luxurians FD-317 M1]|nr:hypothetical protein GYMLUDRAFT_338442 [Collybiopsis luxurians FD-317 M1]
MGLKRELRAVKTIPLTARSESLINFSNIPKWYPLPTFECCYIRDMENNVNTTIGAIFAGCLAAVGLSAILGFQTFLYFQIFPGDALRYKVLVTWTWFIDAVHTVLICTTVWLYAVSNFSNLGKTATNFPTVAITVAITAINTFTVNAFYGWRIHKLSKRNWWLTGPIAALSIARVALGLASTIEMIVLKTFPRFAAHFKIVFTSGLVLSALTDVVVSCARYYYLRNLKEGYSATQEVVDAVVVFTINDGILTCAIVIVAVVCWMVMPNNFVYLGFYFCISKLYSNSVLATLNLRNWYRHRPRPLGLSILRTAANNTNRSHEIPIANQMLPSPTSRKSVLPNDASARMEVFIDRQVEYNVGRFLQESDTESNPPTISMKKTTEMAEAEAL